MKRDAIHLNWTVTTLPSAALLALPVALLLTGCESFKTAPQRGGEEVRSFKPVVAAAPSASGSGVLLSHEFVGGKNVVGEGGCRLRVENFNTKKDQFITLKGDQLGTFAPLEPGVYSTRRIGCGVSKVWNVEDLYTDGFRIEPGRVSYVGKVFFTFTKDELTSVRKGTRIENAEALSATIGLLPKGGRESLISAFTGRPITTEMIEGERREGFDVFAQGTAKAQDLLEPLIARLRTCGTETAKRDPLRFGQLEMVAIYKQGRFIEYKSKKETDALSNDFKACIDTGMKEFRPMAGSDLEVRVKY